MMKFAITVAEFKPGETTLLLGPEVGIEKHIENIKALAEMHGAGDVEVAVFFSNGTKKHCRLNMEDPCAKKAKPAKAKTD